METFVIDHNCETQEIVEREMTEAELEQAAADEARAADKAAKAAEKAAARVALLDRLGITEAEARLLLG